MPKYKVLRPCFHGGIHRVPGGKHDPVVTASPIKGLKSTSALELIKPETAAQKKKRIAAEKKDKAVEISVTGETTDEPIQTNSGESFMGEAGKDNDVGLETL